MVELEGRTFLQKSTGCLRWTGQTTVSGKPVINYKPVDKMIWEERFGRIPNNLELYHSCQCDDCVNIDHMYVKPEFLVVEYVEKERIKERGRQYTVEHKRKKRRKPRNYQPRHINPITAAELKEYFYYDDKLRWKVAMHGVYPGQEVGTKNTLHQICSASLNGVMYRLEDLVWIFFNGPLYECERIVPINGDTMDCRIENLHKIDVFPK